MITTKITTHYLEVKPDKIPEKPVEKLPEKEVVYTKNIVNPYANMEEQARQQMYRQLLNRSQMSAGYFFM